MSSQNRAFIFLVLASSLSSCGAISSRVQAGRDPSALSIGDRWEGSRGSASILAFQELRNVATDQRCTFCHTQAGGYDPKFFQSLDDLLIGGGLDLLDPRNSAIVTKDRVHCKPTCIEGGNWNGPLEKLAAAINEERREQP